jgi:hypothetical protein
MCERLPAYWRDLLATEKPAQTEDALLELAALLDAEVRVTEIILQALEARIVGLKKVVQLRWLLVAGWVRGCARLYGVHSGFLSLCGPGPGVRQHLRGHLFIRRPIIQYCVVIIYDLW